MWCVRDAHTYHCVHVRVRGQPYGVSFSATFLWVPVVGWAQVPPRQARVPLPASPDLVLYFLSEGRSYYIVQAAHGLLSSSAPPSSAALVARTMRVCHLRKI